MPPFDIRTSIIAVRDYFSAHRLHMLFVIAALVIAVLWTIIITLHPIPPSRIVMATGPEGSAYHELGKRYKELLAYKGIKLELLTTAGSPENLAYLREHRSHVMVGFLQSGITNAKESPGLESLGTVFYEPLWFFYRDVYKGKGIDALRGKKISVGPEGSGTRLVALELLAKNGIDQRFAEFLPLTPEDAADKLLRKEIDAALMLTSWESPVVQRLIADEHIEFVSYPRADAIVARNPHLSKLIMPAGAVDLAKNRPPHDVQLFAPKTSLVVRRDLHPAIQYLLLDAAEKIHSGPGFFQKAGQFPSAESIDLPLSEEALQFHRSGHPFFQRYLPFWMAVLIERLLILIIPIAGIAYPLFQSVPAMVNWQMQRRVNRLYGDLRDLEKELDSGGSGQSIGVLHTKLDRLEDRANGLRVSLQYMNMLYTLREHILLVRERVQTMKGKDPQTAGSRPE